MKERPYFVRAGIKGSCGTVSDSCKIISKQFLAIASDSAITEERAATLMQRLSTGQPAHKCLNCTYQLPYHQHKDHRAIIYLSVRSTKHLNLNIAWEMAVTGCVKPTSTARFGRVLSCKGASLSGRAGTLTGICHLRALPEKRLPAHHQHGQ